MNDIIYDTAIIGGGPAGYTAAMYCARAGITAVILEQLAPGGQMALTSKIENYPGYDNATDGFSLAQKMKHAADMAGAATINAEVLGIDFSNKIKLIKTAGETIKAKTVVVATGANPRKLSVKGEDELVGRGVGYCATCDGMLFKNKVVAVAGGGNSAAEEALFLSKLCQKVYIVHRRDKLRATKAYIDSLSNADNIEFIWNSNITKLISDNTLKAIEVTDSLNGHKKLIQCSGLFVAIGRIPNTAIFKASLALDNSGYIIADETTKTSQPGVFAAGDVRTKALRQIITAASDGAVASYYIEEYLQSMVLHI